MTKDRLENNAIATSISEAIRMGDHRAFALYYERSLDRLFTLVRRIVKDDEDAKNIVHDTFVKLWQNRDRIDSSHSLDAFVSTIAWNASINLLKRKKIHRRFTEEQLHTNDAKEISAHEKLQAHETSERIRIALEEMPPQRRRVFELSRNEELTYQQIARRLDLSYNTVRNHMALALNEIRARLVV